MIPGRAWRQPETEDPSRTRIPGTDRANGLKDTPGSGSRILIPPALPL